MPIDWKELLTPSKTAVLVIECQEGVMGDNAPLRSLVDSVKASGLLPHLATFLALARRAGVRVFHCTVEKRADGLGDACNTPLTASLRGRRAAMSPGSAEARIVAALAPPPGDIVVPRSAGMTAFHDCGLDSYLRNMGISTVIPTGVSVNIAITGATIDAVNRGYRVVIARDCVAAAPPDYAEAMFQNTLRNLAYITTAGQVVAAWGLDWKSGG